MNSCNQMSLVAGKVTMIRRVKNRKSASTDTKSPAAAVAAAASVANQITSQQIEPSLEVPRYLNTYRLESKNKFNCTSVFEVMEEVVRKQCLGVKYDPEKCAAKVQTIAGEIMRRVKQFEFDRYRLIVLVMICSNKNQGITSSAKFLWDASNDRLVTFNFTGGHMIISATCFGIYLD